jgi:hypothetical protein
MATYLECAARYFEAITVRLAALESFSPTSEQINALPERLRLFIANVETVADPACLARDAAVQRDTAEALALRVRELEAKGKERLMLLAAEMYIIADDPDRDGFETRDEMRRQLTRLAPEFCDQTARTK